MRLSRKGPAAVIKWGKSTVERTCPCPPASRTRGPWVFSGRYHPAVSAFCLFGCGTSGRRMPDLHSNIHQLIVRRWRKRTQAAWGILLLRAVQEGLLVHLVSLASSWNWPTASGCCCPSSFLKTVNNFSKLCRRKLWFLVFLCTRVFSEGGLSI